MNLESAKGFGQRKVDLQKEISDYEPLSPGHEGLSPSRRLDDIWERLDKLTEDRPHRHILHVFDGEGLTISFTRTLDSYTEGSLRPEQRFVSVTWTYLSEEVTLETITDSAVVFERDTQSTARRLALVEESLSAAESILQSRAQT